MLKIYNTLNNQKEEFQPIDANQVGIYVCGMTVYDLCHMGHARVMVMFDVITRHLRRNFPNVKYVRNITDIDDKIITRAIENNEDIYTLTNRFIDAMHEDEKSLGVLSPDIEPRATDSIDKMIDMIENLSKKGLAYQGKNGDVFYSVRNFKEYGKLSGKNLDDLMAGARVDIESNKKDPLDFVLWKKAKSDEPKWPSPWGDGRPGWHIECSAMARKYLGKEFDIHAGGLDLIFPHHENEIAQSCCAHNTKNMARYWVHNGYVTVNGEKMSKSAGNFTTVADALTKHRGEAIRYALMAAHYRAPLDYSDGQVSESKQALDRLYRAAGDAVATNPPSEFIDILNDDLNTPQALAFLHQKAKDTNKGDKNAAGEIKACAELLGLLNYSSEEWFRSEADMKDLSVAEIEQLIEERRMARLGKNFSVADEIRQRLASNGIELLDSADGTNWQKK